MPLYRVFDQYQYIAALGVLDKRLKHISTCCVLSMGGLAVGYCYVKIKATSMMDVAGFEWH